MKRITNFILKYKIMLVVCALTVAFGFGWLFLANSGTTFIGEDVTVDNNLTVPTETSWSCGDNITFTYKGSEVTYGTVESQGECWMDRNLGALQVATDYDDSLAYGDLFQWGRLDDGHQKRDSGTTTTLSSIDDPGHSLFIKLPDRIYDWRSPQNNNLWQGVSGINNPCPSGWRIPTSREWDTERLNWTSQNYNGAYVSPLRLPSAEDRFYNATPPYPGGPYGAYWSSTVDKGGTYFLSFYGWNAKVRGYDIDRASGLSVRCVKD